jgi:predicted SAM-dependent methyltransferase
LDSAVIENKSIRHLPPETEVPYFKNMYDTKERFCSYWHQIDEVLKIRPDNLLEIGIGNGFVSHYLKGKGIKIVSMDILAELAPLVVGAVEKIPFAKESFDSILCCEVLEHLPYSSFVPSVKNLAEAARRFIILSLPDVSTVYRVHLELPRMKKIKTMFHHPYPRPVPHTYDGEHHWEIGKKSYSLKRIMADFTLCGLDIIETYRVFEFPYHRFFILKK